MAKFGPSGDKSHVTTSFVGTNGYAAPEYSLFGHLQVKSVVYSFGVVLLQLLMGVIVIDPRRPKGQEDLVQWMKPMHSQKGELKTIIDDRVKDRYSYEAASQAALLALKCLELNPKDRPSIKEVLEVLEQIEEMQSKPENQANRLSKRTSI